MIYPEENSFPRGNKKASTGIKRKSEHDSLFNAQKHKKLKKSREPGTGKEDINLVHLANERILARHVFQEDMTVLACVRNITNHALDVELPGLQTAKITLDAISDSLNVTLKNALKSSDISLVSGILKNLFTLGQYVPCKLKSIEHTQDKTIILGSISPTDINEGRRHHTFKKGELLWAAVKAETDHGYQLDCGVANCRIFLPIQNVEANKELKTGELIWCCIHRVNIENAASTLRVGAKKSHVDSNLTDETISLNLISPGTKVEVFVEKVLKHGIYCKFFENHPGFIHESQLDPPMRKLSSIKEATLINAYVLYVDDITRITHLSMRSLNLDFQQTYARGQKVSAQIIGRNPSGLYLKLSKMNRGWISNKRLLIGGSKNFENNGLIAEKYSNGTNHQCVILSYNHMERVYICGIDKGLLNEKHFTIKDFSVGELVRGTVHDIKSQGVILAVGQVKGFIPNIHLTDSTYSQSLKKKFSLGKKVKARVFAVNNEKLIFTLKSNFIKNEKCLSSLDDDTIGDVYPGLVLKAKPHGLVLSFYNNVEGFVSMNEFNFPITQEYKNSPSSYFPSGQVINVRILNITRDKFLASLILDPSQNKIAEIGSVVRGVILKVEDHGLKVSVPKKGIRGFVPIEHLSIERTLCQPMLETFKVNDEISNLMVIRSDKTGTILSRREAIAYERCNLRVPKFGNIRRGALLRCSVEAIEKNGIFVSSPIKDFSKKIFVKKKFITEKMEMLQIQQSVIARVKNINVESETIVLSLRSQDVFDDDVQNSVSLFVEYLADEEFLRDTAIKNGSPLNKYKIAERVVCTVKQSSHQGCLVKLPNGCQGLVVPSLCGSAKKGDKVEGVVLGYNYHLKYLEISLDPHINKNINPVQDGSMPINQKCYTVYKMLTREQYILALTRKSGNSQFIYIPLKLCENSSTDDIKSYYESETFRVEICGQFSEKPIGFHKQLKYALDRSSKWKTQKSSTLPFSDHITKKDAADTLEEEDEDKSLAEMYDKDQLSDVSNEEGVETDADSESSEENVTDDYIGLDDDSSTGSNRDSGVYSNSSKMTSLNGSKRKLSNGNAHFDQYEETDSEVDDFEEDMAEDVEEETKEQSAITKSETKEELNIPSAVLPSVSNFFSAQVSKKMDDSSSDDEAEGVETKKKKKKLTPTERVEQERVEEERISKVEKELASSINEPQSAEQFERVLAGEPNSSILWMKYMSFYLALAEFEKARAVGKKALETINMTLEDEKFNIWIFLLNLENLYGTKESFDNLFEDALKYNDSFKVYMKVLSMFQESGKHAELEEKIKRAKMKFKQEPEMWIQVAKIYYLLGKFDEARNIKNMCLKSITNAKLQYNLIMKFAILEFSHGEIDVGSTILEKVLETYPNKIGAWLVYIDQLTSKQQLEAARSLFQRAISMSLPLRATKVIYHKYRSFEEKYGTPETLELFKEKAKRILQEKVQAVL